MRRKHTNDETREIGQGLQYLRRERGLTQDELVERVQSAGESLSKIYLSFCENGRNHPSDEMLGRLLRALETTPEAFEGLLQHAPWRAENMQLPALRQRRAAPKPAISGAHRAQFSIMAHALSAAEPLELEDTEITADLVEVISRYGRLTRTKRLQALDFLRALEAPGK